MIKKLTTALLIMAMLFTLIGCGQETSSEDLKDPSDISSELLYTGSMELSYAEEFSVDYYEGDYALVTISGEDRYLLVPEGKDAPSDLKEDITVLNKPMDNIYLAASAAMDMFVSIDAIDSISFSSLKEEGWYIEEAKEAMRDGNLIYAGKYSAPDYELILSGNCSLAFENTMIFHTPEVKEQLEKFGIPVIVDHSSYEKTPQGRMEWVKLCGLLAGKEEAAEQVFKAQEEAIDSVAENEKANKTVAFFYITSNGAANIRKPSDYLPKMIELAGGKYIFDELGDKDDMASSTMTMQMEDFYAGAKDADYLIYNSAIEGELNDIKDFLGKSPLLKDFKAVEEGNVYCTTKNLYQSSMELGTIITDIYYMLNGNDEAMTYLYKVE